MSTPQRPPLSSSHASFRTIVTGGIVIACLLLALSINGGALQGSRGGPVLMTEQEYRQLEELRNLLRLDRERRQEQRTSAPDSARDSLTSRSDAAAAPPRRSPGSEPKGRQEAERSEPTATGLGVDPAA